MDPYGQYDKQAGAYGATRGHHSHMPMMHGDRKHFEAGNGRRTSLNPLPMLFTLLIPWGLFCLVCWCLTFQLHYDNAGLCFVIVALCYILVLLFGCVVVGTKHKAGRHADEGPSWMMFLFVTGLLACILGTIIGEILYNSHMVGHYDMGNLNAYVDIHPNRMRGQQLMDAGRIVFAEGSRLDIRRSMGFKNDDIYCVAPIKLGETETKMAVYDFWAVGKNCCSGLTSDYHCDNFANRKANAGIRLMNSGDRAFYRLAVQQAEATYKIRAVHPLFFEWVEDAPATMEDMRKQGHQKFILFVVAHLALQLFLVIVMALAFSGK